MDDREARTRIGRLLAAGRWLRRNWTDEATLIWERSAAGRPRGRTIWVEALLFVRETIREIWRAQVTARAGSLAYSTLLSMIPLFVAFSTILRNYFGQVFPDFRGQIDAILTMLLPYRSDEVTEQIQRFVENAGAASTLGAIVFIAIAFRLFMAVEGTINTIWKVQGGRSYQQQIRAFTMLLFWGPVLITLSFTTSANIERNPLFGQVIHSPIVVRLVPLLVLFLAFTMLFWLVPATRVRFTSALLAGGITAILFDLVRFGFGLYADYLSTGRLNVIYGTLGLLIIFLIALELMWVIVLTGVVMTYVHQNLGGLVRATAKQLEENPRYDAYYALRALIEIVRRFNERQDAPSSYRLAQHANATDDQMLRILRTLEDEGIVKEIGGDWTGWVPGCDPDSIIVTEVISTLEQRATELPEEEPRDELRSLLAEILHAHEQCRRDALGHITLAQLARQATELVPLQDDESPLPDGATPTPVEN